MFKGIIGALRVDLGMNSAQFHKGASEATLSMRRMQKDFSGLAKDFGKIGGRMSLGLTAPLVAIAKQSMNLQGVQANAVAQVDAALASMGQTAGFTSEQLQSMASGLQGTSLFGDEDILGRVTSTMLTFGNVTGEVFVGAQQAALDMSAALGQDLQSSAIMLGKALNDPVKGLSALSRVGVSFSEQQKATIKTMVELGDVSGAQEKILEALRQQYAGQAQALRDLPSGQIKAAMMDIGDAMEQVGAIVLPVAADIAARVSDMALAFQGLSPETKRFVVIGGAVAASLGPALLALGGMAAAASALLPVVVAIASPIGLMVGGFAALAAGAVYVGVKLKGAMERVGGFGTALALAKDVASEAFARIGDAGQILQNRMAEIWQTIEIGALKMLVAVQTKWADFLHGIKDQLRDVPGMDDAYLAVGNAAISAGAKVYATQAAIDELQGSIGNMQAENAKLAEGIKAPLKSVAALKAALAETSKTGEAGAGEVEAATVSVTKALEESGDAVSDLDRKLGTLGRNGKSPIKDLKEEVTDLGRAVQGTMASFASGDIAGALGDLKSGLGNAASQGFGDLLQASLGKDGAGIGAITGGLSSAFGAVTSELAGGLSMAGIGSALSAAMPIIGAVTAGIGLIKSFSSKKLIGSGLQLGVQGGGLAGGTFETTRKSSWWGLKKRTSTSLAGFDAATQAMLDDQLGEVQASVAKAFKLAGTGVTTSMVAGVDVALDQIDTKGLSESEVQAKVEAWFAGYADTVTQAFAGVGYDALQDFATLKALLDPIGHSFVGTLQNMALSADALADIAGGIDTLASRISSFTQGFYTDAERFRMVSASVHGQFAELGLAVPKTTEEFRNLVTGQDLMTTAGQKTYATLLALSDQFLEFDAGTRGLWSAFADVSAMLTPLGQGFAGTAQAMVWASDDLINAAGGLSSLSGQIAGFTNTFYSESEQLGMASEELGRRLGALGLAVPQTARQFRDLVTGQDLMTEAGRKTYAALLSLSDLFVKVKGGVTDLAEVGLPDLSGGYDLGSYYASEFDARLASIADARGYAADVHAAGDAGVTLAASLGRLSEGDTAQTNALRRLVDLIEGWEAIGMPVEREF
tara:strand:- start:493 stop:3780 length:3288 start_codon:yes stop_codon:yes gene_type:complete